jgi:hypothetical protein
MWFNTKIPENDFEIIIVGIQSELVTKEIPELLSLLNHSEYQERKMYENVMIHYILKKSIINDIRERLLDSENGGSEHFKDKVGNNEIGFSFIVTKKNNQIVESMYSPCFILNKNY